MNCASTLVFLIAFSLSGLVLRAQRAADAQQPAIVVSGFEPFGGRDRNASWTLAREIA